MEMENIKEFLLEYIEREYSLPEGTDIDSFNYIEEGFIDSLGILGIIAEIEDNFGISFTDEELSGEEFKVIGTLANMIKRKMEE